MKKSFAIAALAVASLSMTSLAAATEFEERVLHAAYVYPPGTIWHDTTVRFAEAVAERTGGKVTFQIAHSGMTGSWEHLIEGLQIGTNDIVLESIGTLDRYDPLPGVEAFPYLVRDLDHFNAIYYGEVGAAFMDEVSKRTGFRIIGAGYRGARKLSANRAIESVEDLAGLRLRVPPLRMYRQTWEYLGASPTPMPATEIYTGLQQGIIDGQENPLEFIDSMNVYEVQSHIMNTDHVIGAMTFIFDQARFDSYQPELQEILIEEGQAAMKWGSQRMLEMENDYIRTFEEAGVTIVSLDREPFRERVAPLAAEFPELAEWVERFQNVK